MKFISQQCVTTCNMKNTVQEALKNIALLVYLFAVGQSSSFYLKVDLPGCELLVGHSTLPQLQRLKDKDPPFLFPFSWDKESGEVYVFPLGP